MTSIRSAWTSWRVKASSNALKSRSRPFVDVPDLSGAEYEDKVDEFFALWEHAVAAAEIELGRPAFDDGGAARGYPEDQDAVWLALWPLPTGRLMIQELHEDRELPFRLAVVVTPPMT